MSKSKKIRQLTNVEQQAMEIAVNALTDQAGHLMIAAFELVKETLANRIQRDQQGFDDEGREFTLKVLAGIDLVGVEFNFCADALINKKRAA